MYFLSLSSGPSGLTGVHSWRGPLIVAAGRELKETSFENSLATGSWMFGGTIQSCFGSWKLEVCQVKM